MAHELQDYIKTPQAKKAVKRGMISLPGPVYDRVTKLSTKLDISRAAAIEGLLNYLDDKPQVGS